MQGEEYVPGTGALNVQLSSEETYAGALSPPALLPVCCNRIVAACYLHEKVLQWTCIANECQTNLHMPHKSGYLSLLLSVGLQLRNPHAHTRPVSL